MIRKKIVFLVGPTAAGKTDAAVLLARKINAEIISCDSMQVYKGMDIGTQKPSADIRKKVKHHMIDIVTPDKEFSAADFRRKALRLIDAVHKKGKVPLFVGGTGFYMKALIDGLFPSPPKNEKLREKLYRENETKGAGYLWSKLNAVDPETAKGIHPNDIKKIVRALEVFYTAKKKMSELKNRTRPLSDKFDIKIFGLERDRQELYCRINERVDRMFEEGLLAEANKFADKPLSLTASQAIGYRETLLFLRKQESKKEWMPAFAGMTQGENDIEELKDLIKKNTRHYAKRQMTWFRADKSVIWIVVSAGQTPEDIVEEIIAVIAGESRKVPSEARG